MYSQLKNETFSGDLFELRSYYSWWLGRLDEVIPDMDFKKDCKEI